MIVFELTFPNIGSWNGHWSGEKETHIIAKPDKSVNKSLVGKNFYYNFLDGWGANISVKHYHGNSKEYKNIKNRNTGFCGYDWMVRSIIKHGKIIKPKYLGGV